MEQLADTRQGRLLTTQELARQTDSMIQTRVINTLQCALNTLANRIGCTRLDIVAASLTTVHLRWLLPTSLRLGTPSGDGRIHTPRTRKFLMSRQRRAKAHRFTQTPADLSQYTYIKYRKLETRISKCKRMFLVAWKDPHPPHETIGET